jgi:hypothetical protein
MGRDGGGGIGGGRTRIAVEVGTAETPADTPPTLVRAREVSQRRKVRWRVEVSVFAEVEDNITVFVGHRRRFDPSLLEDRHGIADSCGRMERHGGKAIAQELGDGTESSSALPRVDCPAVTVETTRCSGRREGRAG